MVQIELQSFHGEKLECLDKTCLSHLVTTNYMYPRCPCGWEIKHMLI